MGTRFCDPCALLTRNGRDLKALAIEFYGNEP
jgi:hypothetical protein